MIIYRLCINQKLFIKILIPLNISHELYLPYNLEKEYNSEIMKKNKKSIKRQMIVTFVLGTILANLIIAIVSMAMIHIHLRMIRLQYGSEVVPSIQLLAFRVLIVMVAILVLLGVLLYSGVYRNIINPLKDLSKATQRIADGDLDFEMDIRSFGNEIDDLCIDFENMRRRLKDNAEQRLHDEEENRKMISNIAHDLKTPVTSIKGYAEGLLDGIAETPEKQERYLNTICKKAAELDRLMNELTFYTHIDQSRIPYNFTKIEIGNFFTDCVDELKDDLEQQGFKISLKNELFEPAIIIADPVQLKKVINNIVGNSVKYGDKSQGRIRIQIKDAEEFVLVEIADNGKGISQKDLPQIFDRFFRSDVSRSSTTGGSGIGLSIVKKIIEDHGGRIWATSAVDEGTTMHIELRKYVETAV